MKILKVLTAVILSAILAVSLVSCGSKSNDIIPEVDEKTGGGIMWNAFQDACKDNDNALSIATAVSENEAIQFMPFAQEIEPGFLSGFDEEINGFKNGATFGPQISSIPFVGYVFELEKDANATEFVNMLKDTCNPAWNICTEAEQTVVGTNGNFVFFVMCPSSLGD